MSRRPNHTLMGFAFIAACLIIAATIYVAGRNGEDASKNLASPASDQELMTNPAESYPPSEMPAPEVLPPSPARDRNPGATLGNCHGGECDWFRILSQQAVRQDATGRLVRVELLDGTSADGEGEYPVAWENLSHTAYVFCSTTLPTVMLKSAYGVRADVLPIIDGPPTVQMTALAIYGDTCHAEDRAIFDNSPETLGYKILPDGAIDIQVDNPEDIFKFAAALTAS